ncbi:TonB-dependent receptor domain-containing protein [Maribacter antarcticus]|uniref:TonB-dependent receptor domain-containing protein n=1 Tax=Maribacter antarcticus TaxID=505250 RepID=UPI00047AA0C0|nr:TonB-dependent receptor [Maribacter antarcticus]
MKNLNVYLLRNRYRDKSLSFIIKIIFFMLLTNSAFAQSQGTLTGVVLDGQTQEPLVGVTIYIDELNVYAITDFDGKYSITSISSGTYKVTCSYIGYKNIIQQITVDGQQLTLDFNMKVDVLSLDAVVVTGVASKNSKAVAAVAVARVNVDDLTDKVNYNGVDDLLTGKVAGVSVQKSGGGFGSGSRFVVRAGAGINGNGQPLIFIDGVRLENNSSTGTGGSGRGSGGISSLVGLNNEDIANIEVIKGPAGSASYGTGAANGVILITTKRGAAGGLEVNYRSTVGFHDVGNVLDERNYRNHEFLRSDVFQTGAIFKNSLNVSGGNDVFRAFFSIDRNEEEGITPDNSIEQTSTRFNIDFNPSSKFSLKGSTQYSSTDILLPQRGRGDGEFGSVSFNPANYNPDFDPTRPSFWDTSSDDNKINNFTASFQGKYIPFAESGSALKGLSAAFTAGVTSRNENGKFVQKRTSEAIEGVDNPGTVIVANDESSSLTFTNNIDYSYDFGKFSGLISVGSQIFSQRSTGNYIAGEDIPPGFSTLNAANTIFPPTETAFNSKSAGIFASTELSYDDIFYSTFMIRRDYSSVLGNLAPSISYPAGSFLIRWDKFDFMPEIFSFLKTRVAYGESGTLPDVTAGIPFLYAPGASQYGVGLDVTSLGNPLLEPERIQQFEVGLEAEVGNFGLELTYYTNKAKKSLVPRPPLSSTGLANFAPFVNVGSVEGSGVELTLSTSFGGEALGGWRAGFTLLGAYQENTVTNLGFDGQIQGGPGGGTQVFRTGFPRGAYVNSVTLGALFSDGTNIQQIEGLPNEGEVVPVGALYDFQNSDGDVFIGVNDPAYTASFSTNISVGDFSFYALLTAKTGFEVYNEQTIDQIFFGLDTDYFNGTGTNYLAFDRLYQQLGYGDFGTGDAVLTPGTPAYTDAANQFASLSPFNDANGIQTADFLRLQEISLSYNLKKLASKSKFIKALNIGVTASNVLTWYKRTASRHTVTSIDTGEEIERWISGYSGLDSQANAGAFTSSPSTGVQSGQLPPSRTFSSFVTLKF